MKEIRVEAKKRVPLDDLHEFRFVKIDVLTVRQNPGSRSPQLDELRLGKTVRLLKRGKGWSEIEYRDELTNELKTGWVFSRYLAHFS